MLIQTLNRLFFAIKPATAIIPGIEDVRRLYCAGRPVRPEHYHVTMEIFDDRIGMPGDLIRQLRRIGDDICMPGFELPLGRLVGTTQSVAIRPAGRSRGLSLLQRAIHERVLAAGLTTRDGWSFSPHLTLGYREGGAFSRSIPPLSWYVDELVLIHSFVGETRHEIVGCWALEPELPLFQ